MAAYRILKKLGEGGMGVVYLAVQTSLDRQIALKLLTESCRANPQSYGRFLREVQASTRVSHENIIKIIDYGEIEGQPFYAMEFLDAPSLDEKYKRGGVLPFALATKVAEQLLAALSCMHKAGLVHRDLKPANVMLDDAGHATLMDFGLVKDLERTQLTAQGKIVGTPGYLSPEAITGRAVDGRADLFSLGILLWEVLCGERPFSGDSLSALLVAIVRGPHVPVVKRRPDCPPYLTAFIDRLLVKDPAGRYPSALAALQALRVAQGKALVREDAADDSVDDIIDFSGELPLEGPVPQGSIEGGLKMLASVPEAAVKPHTTGSIPLPISGLRPPAEGPDPALVTTGSVPKRTRSTRPVPRVTRPIVAVTTAQPATAGVSPVAAAAAAGVVAAAMLVGAWVALSRTPAPIASPSPSPSALAVAGDMASQVTVASPGTDRETGAALSAALARFAPHAQIARMQADLAAADKRVVQWYGTSSLAVSGVRETWRERLAKELAGEKIPDLLNQFTLRREEYYRDPTVPPAERLALYLRLHELQDLANWCQRALAPLRIDPALGFAESYGLLRRSALPVSGTQGVVLSFALFEHADPANQKRVQVPAGYTEVKLEESERFFGKGDSRKEDVVTGLENAVNGVEHLRFEYGRELQMPRLEELAELELCGWVSDLAVNNRYVISVAQDLETFRDVAVVRGAASRLVPFSHTLERGLFTGSKLRIAVRFEFTKNMYASSEYSNFLRLGVRYRRKP